MKALRIMKKLVVIAITVLAVGMLIFTVISAATFNRMDRDLFGYRAFIVLSDSMSATDFSAGDLVVVKKVDPATLAVGDIIAYQSTNTENYGGVVTHKIRALTNDADGNPGFITYGTTTDTNDENVVTYSYVLGKYQVHFVGVGTFFSFLKTTPGYILCIFIPFLVLIMAHGLDSMRLFRQYKREQEEELKAEREKLEQERVEAQQMLQELMKLRSELTGQPEKAPLETDGQDDT